MIDKNNEYLTEKKGGFISSAIKDVADVDTDAIRDVWRHNQPGMGNGAKGAANVMTAVANKGIKPAADTASELDRMLNKGKVDTRSIIARAKNSVLQFPCYVTQSMPVNAAQILSKTFERVYASFVQTAIAQKKIIDESEANELLFLKQFHTNLKESVDVMYGGFYQPIDDLDAILKESVFAEYQITPDMTVEFRYVPETASEYLVKECARLSSEPLDGFTYLQEAEKKGFVAKKVAKREQDAYNASHDKETSATTQTQLKPLTDAELIDIICDRDRISSEDKKLLQMSLKDVPDDKKDDKKEIEDRYDRALTAFKAEISRGKVKGYEIDGAGRIRTKISTSSTSTKVVQRKAPETIKGPEVPTLLREVEIKKMNSIAPYMIECHFRVRSQGKLDTDVHYLIGVKTIMHLIRTQDLAEDLRELVTGKIKSLQKVRYKTGEISYWEYLFNTKAIKKDAGKSINYNKRWVNTLKRLSEFDKTHGSLMRGPVSGLNKGDIPIPNGTLILTQPDVTSLTNETGIDLSVVGNAVRLAKSLFLIAVVIVDSSAGTMRYIFPDNMTDWDVQSLSAIDAEVAKTDNSQLMRELNRLVNK